MSEHTQRHAGGAPQGSRALFSAKLRIPGVVPGTVRRPRLHELLDHSLTAGTVIVTGPAGSGKTTLLADWAREQHARRHVAWLTLGEAERDPTRFLEYALAALTSSSGAGTGLESAASLPPVPAEVDEHYLAAVAQDLVTLTGERVLVLDDFERVMGSATERLLRRILRHRPFEHVRLVVLSRRDPALGQTKLRLRRHLREIGPADLGLTADEVTELALRRRGHAPTSAQVAVLHAQTLGWASGLETVLASWEDEQDGDVVEQALLNARPRIAEYLDAEVLRTQPPEIVDFLHRIATVDDVCGELADVLTEGAGGGAATLADLSRDRMFLEPDGSMSDERCTWYHWNPLVAAVLRGRLRDRDPDLADRLHLAASRWYRGHRAPVQAVHHALTAGDVEAAASVLATSWFALASSGRTAALRPLLSSFDEDRLSADPELLVVGAFIAMVDRELPRAALLARRAQSGASALTGDRRLAVEITSTAVRLRCAAATGAPDVEDLQTAAPALVDRLVREQRAVTRPDRSRRALLLHALGSFELTQWHYEEAREHLAEALTEAASLGMADLLPRIRAELATVEVFTGRLELARSTGLDVVEEIHHRTRPSGRCLAAAHLAVATVDLHRGDPEAALVAAVQASAGLRPTDRVDDVRVRVVRHAALLLQGHTAEAEDELHDLREVVRGWDGPSWVGLLTAVATADQHRTTGRVEAALRTLESAAALAAEPLANQVWRNAYAQALLDADRPAEARALVAESVAGRGDRPLEVQALVIDCLAAERLDRTEESASSLVQAIRLSRRERIVRPFLLRADRVRPLLEALLDTGTAYEDYVRELLSRLPAPDGAPAAPVEELTARELEVLRAMRGSATNDHIAADMFISVNTLRSHIKQINRKLGTTSRQEAVARARRLGLV